MVRTIIKPLKSQLSSIQGKYGIDIPVNFASNILGLTEAWCHGISWYNLCLKTSLDQGDLSRILLQTIEILRDIVVSNELLLSPILSTLAFDALTAMDRFPVHEDDIQGTEEAMGKLVNYTRVSEAHPHNNLEFDNALLMPKNVANGNNANDVTCCEVSRRDRNYSDIESHDSPTTKEPKWKNHFVTLETIHELISN